MTPAAEITTARTRPTRLWILGASDPEMAAIESLLTKLGEKSVYATKGGMRVHPANAYQADPIDEDGYAELLLVECAPTSAPIDAIVIDHHRPGDPGFGCAPSQFFRASSIGQVVEHLSRRDLLAAVDWVRGYHGYRSWYGGCGWIYWYHGRWWGHANYTACAIPRDLVFTAAADHCLGAAYRGECPGVDPDELAAWRLRSRAEFQRRDLAEMLRDYASTRARLESAPILDLGGGLFAADMRGPVAPELPEVATRLGLAYVSGPLDTPDGRCKFTCSGSAEHIQQFLAGWAAANGICDTYGDPARGFAGGYAAALQGETR